MAHLEFRAPEHANEAIRLRANVCERSVMSPCGSWRPHAHDAGAPLASGYQSLPSPCWRTFSALVHNCAKYAAAEAVLVTSLPSTW